MRHLPVAAAVATLGLLFATSAACKHSFELPLPQLITSAPQLKGFRDEAEVAVAAFVPSDSSPTLHAFAKMAAALRRMKGFKSAYVTDRSLLDSRCATDCDSPVAVLTKRGKATKPIIYNGEFEPHLLIQWGRSHAAPSVARFKEDPAVLQHFHRAWDVDLPQLLVVLESPKDITPEVLAAVEDAAAANDDIKFFITSKAEGQHLLQEVDVPLATPAPFFLVQYTPNGTSHMRSGMHLDQLAEFIYEYKEGALAQTDAEQVEERANNRQEL